VDDVIGLQGQVLQAWTLILLKVGLQELVQLLQGVAG
jgi:hypothetical protein